MRSSNVHDGQVMSYASMFRRGASPLGTLGMDMPETWLRRTTGCGRFLHGSAAVYRLPTPTKDRTALTLEDIRKASKLISDRLDPDVIDAIARTESRKSGFMRDGRPMILFERRYFHRLTGGKFDTFPELSHAKGFGPGGYGTYAQQYGKLERALALDVDAALKSCSWGRFQVMGSHAEAMGYGSVRRFVVEMYRSEAAHLEAFVRYWKHLRASSIKALLTLDWASIARAYNGRNYKANAYDSKLLDAWQRAKAERLAKVGISGSVGAEGVNATEDVIAVQVLLRMNRIHQGGPITGRCTPQTIEAIKAFQRLFLPTPDGLVEPEGVTWKRLVRRVK